MKLMSMGRALILAGGVVATVTVAAVPASAQVVHSISFGVGMFTPRSIDNRATGDVWVADLTQPAIDPADPNTTSSLLFDIKDFRSWPVSGEWHIAFGPHVELGVGAGYTNQTVHSVYRDLVNGHDTVDTSDDTEIAQALRLQTIPITGVVRFLGGRPGHFQPYAGIGVDAIVFKYSESGEFVDTSDLTVFTGKFTANGTAFGPVILGGARVPLGGDVYALNFEGRYVWAVGKTEGTTNGVADFLGNRLDLGGWFLGASFLIRF